MVLKKRIDRKQREYGGWNEYDEYIPRHQFTEPGWNLHTPNEIGSRTLIYFDDFQANRSPDKRYRTTPFGGLFTRAKGGFYHDGRFADLAAVVDHYDQHLGLNQTAAEKNDLIEYLKSLLHGHDDVGTTPIQIMGIAG